MQCVTCVCVCAYTRAQHSITLYTTERGKGSQSKAVLAFFALLGMWHVHMSIPRVRVQVCVCVA